MKLPNIFHRRKRPIFLHHTLYHRLLYFYVCNKIVPLSAYNSVHIYLELWCREPTCVNNWYFMMYLWQYKVFFVFTYSYVNPSNGTRLNAAHCSSRKSRLFLGHSYKNQWIFQTCLCYNFHYALVKNNFC